MKGDFRPGSLKGKILRFIEKKLLLIFLRSILHNAGLMETVPETEFSVYKFLTADMSFKYLFM